MQYQSIDPGALRTARLRPSLLCDIRDGCSHNSFVWIDHIRQAIFFEVPKCASTSIRKSIGVGLPRTSGKVDRGELELKLPEVTVAALVRALGHERAIAWLRSLAGGIVPQHADDPDVSQILHREIAECIEATLIRRTSRLAGFSMFAGTPTEAIHLYPHYFSFTFIRSPWQRMVSNWSMFCSGRKQQRSKQVKAVFGEDAENMSFGEFLRRSISAHNHHWQPITDYLPVAAGKLNVDFVGRLESIEDDWIQIVARIDVDATLPMLNVSDQGNYRELFSEDDRSIFASKHRLDVELLGYDY